MLYVKFARTPRLVCTFVCEFSMELFLFCEIYFNPSTSNLLILFICTLKKLLFVFYVNFNSSNFHLYYSRIAFSNWREKFILNKESLTSIYWGKSFQIIGNLVTRLKIAREDQLLIIKINPSNGNTCCSSINPLLHSYKVPNRKSLFISIPWSARSLARLPATRCLGRFNNTHDSCFQFMEWFPTFFTT